jgi:transposase
MKPASNEKRQSVKVLLLQGLSSREISKRTGLGKSTVNRMRKEFPDAPKSNSPGRPAVLTPRDKRLVVQIINSKEIDNAVQAQRVLCNGHNITVSTSTIRRTLKKEGYIAVSKKKKAFLSARHRKARLDFARTYSGWTVEDWKRVVFSDETKINRICSDGKQYCYKKKGSAISEKQVNGTLKFGGGSIMIWSCLTAQGVGYETLIEGCMDSDLYIHILATDFLDTLEFYGMDRQEIIFQHDNDPKHTSKKTKKWLQDENLSVLQWPAQSPDLNPIENLWYQVKSELAKLNPPPTSSKDLWEKFSLKWREITPERCEKLISSMPRRIQAVLKTKGGYTKY